MSKFRWSEYVRIPKQLVTGKLSPAVTGAQLDALHLLWSIRHFDGEEHVLPERWTKFPEQQKRAIANLKLLLKRKQDAWIEVGGEKIPLLLGLRIEPACTVPTSKWRWVTFFHEGKRYRTRREIPDVISVPARYVVTLDPRIVEFFRGMKRGRGTGYEFAKIDIVKAEKLPNVAAKRLLGLAAMHAGRQWPHWTSKVDVLFGILGLQGKRKDKATAAVESAAKIVAQTFHVRHAALGVRKHRVPIEPGHMLKHAPVYKGKKLVAFRFHIIDGWLDMSKEGKIDVEVDVSKTIAPYVKLPEQRSGWRQRLVLLVGLERLHKRKAPPKPVGVLENLDLTERALRERSLTSDGMKPCVRSVHDVVRKVDEDAYPVAWAQEYADWKDRHDRHEAAREDVERAAAKGSNWAAEQLHQRQRLSEYLAGADPDHFIEAVLDYPG